MDRRTFTQLSAVTLLGAPLALSACQGDAASSLLVGKTLPAIKGVLSNGAGMDLGAIKLPAVIRVWGLWCPPCVVDEPNWQAVIRQLRANQALAQRVNLLAIHVGRTPANGPSLDEWARAQAADIAVPQVDDATNTIMEAMGIPGTPSTLIVDDKGMIRDHAWQFNNQRGVANFLRKVEALLG